MKVMNKKNVQLLLEELRIIPNKKFGQNFLIDNNVLTKIISIAEVSDKDIVLEIGGGLGALTTELIKKSKYVIVYEIDYKLYQFLLKKFSKFDNITFFNQDILKAEVPYHSKVVSNIPYSITGPLIEKLFYNENPPNGTLIIEQAIANRIFFPHRYKDFSRISITSNAFINPVKKIPISQNCFYPNPKINLSLVQFKPKEKINPFLKNREKRAFFLKFVANIMPYKNKNIINALDLFLKNSYSYKIKKQSLTQLLEKNNYQNEKLFNFDIHEFIKLSELLYNYIEHQ